MAEPDPTRPDDPGRVVVHRVGGRLLTRPVWVAAGTLATDAALIAAAGGFLPDGAVAGDPVYLVGEQVTGDGPIGGPFRDDLGVYFCDAAGLRLRITPGDGVVVLHVDTRVAMVFDGRGAASLGHYLVNVGDAAAGRGPLAEGDDSGSGHGIPRPGTDPGA